jgi:hypothetical protein
VHALRHEQVSSNRALGSARRHRCQGGQFGGIWQRLPGADRRQLVASGMRSLTSHELLIVVLEGERRAAREPRSLLVLVQCFQPNERAFPLVRLVRSEPMTARWSYVASALRRLGPLIVIFSSFVRCRCSCSGRTRVSFGSLLFVD